VLTLFQPSLIDISTAVAVARAIGRAVLGRSPFSDHWP
jgi:hypothetical protein